MINRILHALETKLLHLADEFFYIAYAGLHLGNLQDTSEIKMLICNVLIAIFFSIDQTCVQTLTKLTEEWS